MNKVDNKATNLLLSTEKRCKNLRTGVVEYSPILSNLGFRQRFWQKVTQFRQRRFFDLDNLNKVAKYLKIEDFLRVPICQCISNLKEAKAEYLLHKFEQRKLRDEYINSLNSSEAKKKQNSKKMKQQWRILKKYFSKSKSKSILEVEYTNEGCTVRVSSQFQVKRVVIAENSKCFVLAYSSPLL